MEEFLLYTIGKIYYLIDFGILPTAAIHFRYKQKNKTMINDKAKYKQFEHNDLLWLHESENLNHNETYTPFYGDVTELNTERTIIDLVGKETLSNIVSELMDLLETSVAIYEKNGDYAFGMFSSGWCQLMDNDLKVKGDYN